MASDIFCKVEGIKGECTDDAHTDEIEVLDFKHHIFQPSAGSMSTGGGASAERATHGEFIVSKALDLASPKLVEACCKGTHIKEVILSLNRAGGDKVEYMNYKLSHVMITSVEVGGDTAQNVLGDGMPTERVSFVYGKIDWEYTQQKLADGTGGGKVAAGWDCTKNIAV